MGKGKGRLLHPVMVFAACFGGFPLAVILFIAYIYGILSMKVGLVWPSPTQSRLISCDEKATVPHIG